MKSKIEKSKYIHETCHIGFEIQNILYHLNTDYLPVNRSLEDVSDDIKKDKEFV